MGKKQLFKDSMFPPSLEMVKSYFKEKGSNDAEAAHFFAFNQLKQWRTDSGELMKSWRSTAWSWIRSANTTKP